MAFGEVIHLMCTQIFYVLLGNNAISVIHLELIFIVAISHCTYVLEKQYQSFLCSVGFSSPAYTVIYFSVSLPPSLQAEILSSPLSPL